MPLAPWRLAGLALLDLARGLLETAIVVEVVAVAVAATGGHPEGLPLLGTLAAPPLALVAAVVVTTAVTAGVQWWSEHLIAAFSTAAIVGARSRLLRAYCRAGWLEQQAERAGTLQELVTTTVTIVGQGAIVASGALVAAAHLAVVTISAVSISPLAALAVLGIGALAVLVAHPFRNRTRRIAREAADANRDLATIVAETTALSGELRANGVHETVAEQARKPVADAARLFSRVRFGARIVPALMRDLTVAAVAVGIGLLGLVSSVAIASLGATVLLLMRAIGYGQQVSMAVQSLADRRVHLDRLDAALTRYEGSAAPSGELRPARGATVRLDAVHFVYPAANHPSLRGATLALAPGEVVGVVGASGAGKSTLLHLLLGLVPPTSGRITVGDVDLADVDPAVWCRRVGFVAQDPGLLTGTVAENIRFRREWVSDAAVESAALAAALAPELAEWPAGLDHPVGPLGNALSGGQRQRVALARALAGAPELLVLDEPTSALDAASEAAVCATLNHARGAMTVLVVAHRLSTLEVCDRLVELRDGCLVDADRGRPTGRGIPTELVAG